MQMMMMEFNPDTYVGTYQGNTYEIGAAALAAGMRLTDVGEDNVGTVTFNPDVIDVRTACVMAGCLYFAEPKVEGDQAGVLKLYPAPMSWFSEACHIPGSMVAPYISDKSSPSWKPETQVPYITPYMWMALNAIPTFKVSTETPVGPTGLIVKDIKVVWSTEFNPNCMLGIEVRFSVRLTMESGPNFILSIQDRATRVHYQKDWWCVPTTVLELGPSTHIDQDLYRTQLLTVLKMYTDLTYGTVQEYYNGGHDWVEVEDGMPEEWQDVKYISRCYDDQAGEYVHMAVNGYYLEGRFWDRITSQPAAEVTKWKPLIR